jgi:hypothetical protein
VEGASIRSHAGGGGFQRNPGRTMIRFGAGWYRPSRPFFKRRSAHKVDPSIEGDGDLTSIVDLPRSYAPFFLSSAALSKRLYCGGAGGNVPAHRVTTIDRKECVRDPNLKTFMATPRGVRSFRTAKAKPTIDIEAFGERRPQLRYLQDEPDVYLHRFEKV